MEIAEERKGADLVAGAIRRSALAMVLTDPRLDDNPIVYVNEAFQKLSLYSRDYATGRNCRFLQGPDTDPEDVERIRKGLRSEQEFQVTLTNYRADGTAFLNQLLVTPIHSEDGELTGYFGVLHVVDDETPHANPADDDMLALLKELQHRVKNHLSMVVSMIRIQATRAVTPESFRAVSRRVEALALLYEQLLDGQGNGSRHIAAGAYLSRIVSTVAGLQPRRTIRVKVDCEEIDLAADHAARLGLLLSEFLTNALEHAFEGRDTGCVEVGFHRLDNGRVRLLVQDDGTGLSPGSTWPFGAPSIEKQHARAQDGDGKLDTTGHGQHSGVGGSIVAALARSLGADIEVESPAPGTRITLEFEPSR